jgi:hypothetical protein
MVKQVSWTHRENIAIFYLLVILPLAQCSNLRTQNIPEKQCKARPGSLFLYQQSAEMPSSWAKHHYWHQCATAVLTSVGTVSYDMFLSPSIPFGRAAASLSRSHQSTSVCFPSAFHGHWCQLQRLSKSVAYITVTFLDQVPFPNDSNENKLLLRYPSAYFGILIDVTSILSGFFLQWKVYCTCHTTYCRVESELFPFCCRTAHLVVSILPSQTPTTSRSYLEMHRNSTSIKHRTRNRLWKAR